MSNEQPEQPQHSSASRRSLLPWDQVVRLTGAQLGLLNIDQVEQILDDNSLETYQAFIYLFAPLAQLTSSETARAFSLVAGGARRTHTAGDEGSPDCGMFMSELKREEELTEALTEQTTLHRLSELLWERHTAP